MHEACDPVVLGGSGGSGTRLVAELCLLAGYDMGTRLNKSYEALAFARFYTTWVNPWRLLARGVISGGSGAVAGEWSALGMGSLVSVAGQIDPSSDILT